MSSLYDTSTKFIKQGQLTLRFVSPSHDLIIKGNILLLENVMKLIKLAQISDPVLNLLLSSPCTPFSIETVRKTVTKLAVEQKQDYPVLEGFPSTLEVLQVCGIQQSHFDERILHLEMLKILDLSDNNLSTLPSLESLSNLRTLVLAKNNLGSSSSDWLWLSGESLRKNLRELDLSNNSLSVLPEDVYDLLSLMTLNVSNNQLTHLGFRIEKLSFLRFFFASHNNLCALPCTVRNLKILEINLSENDFVQTEVIGTAEFDYGIPSLFHVSAQRVLEYRLPYSSRNLPLKLVRFLNEAGFCWCGRAGFNSNFRCYPYFSIPNVRIIHGNRFFPIEIYACSDDQAVGRAGGSMVTSCTEASDKSSPVGAYHL